MRTAPTRGCRQVAGLAAAWALFGAAHAAQPTPAPASRDAPRQSAIVQFEEKRGSGIIYFEERGGMTTKAAAPAAKREEAAGRDDPTPAKTQPAPAKAVAVAARK